MNNKSALLLLLIELAILFMRWWLWAEYQLKIWNDSHKSYIGFATNHVAHHYRIPRGKHKTGVYHINHVNSLHSKFKNWIRQFNGVSTKFLSNYLY